MILPYVYKLINEITEEFYFGYRSKNVRLHLKAEDDIGIKYFTSSKYIKNNFENFRVEILAEFFSADAAYDYEQELISQYFNDIKCLNRHYQKRNEKGRFRHNCPHTDKSKEKMSGTRGKINRIKPGHPAWNKGLTKNNDLRVAKMSLKRQASGNDHQIGAKYSQDRIDNIKKKLIGRKVPVDQIQKMSGAKKGKTWEEIYGDQGAEHRRENSKFRTGKNHSNSKPIFTPDGNFDSITEAVLHFGVSDYTIRKRCLSTKERWKDWYYL